ncbi:hypothetical protein CVT24_002889, partial [Panaeolus cyanescens]
WLHGPNAQGTCPNCENPCSLKGGTLSLATPALVKGSASGTSGNASATIKARSSSAGGTRSLSLGGNPNTPTQPHQRRTQYTHVKNSSSCSTARAGEIPSSSLAQSMSPSLATSSLIPTLSRPRSGSSSSSSGSGSESEGDSDDSTATTTATTTSMGGVRGKEKERSLERMRMRVQHESESQHQHQHSHPQLYQRPHHHHDNTPKKGPHFTSEAATAEEPQRHLMTEAEADAETEAEADSESVHLTTEALELLDTSKAAGVGVETTVVGTVLRDVMERSRGYRYRYGDVNAREKEYVNAYEREYGGGEDGGGGVMWEDGKDLEYGRVERVGRTLRRLIPSALLRSTHDSPLCADYALSISIHWLCSGLMSVYPLPGPVFPLEIFKEIIDRVAESLPPLLDDERTSCQRDHKFDTQFRVADGPLYEPDADSDSEPDSLTNTSETDISHTTNLPTPSEPQATSTSTTHAAGDNRSNSSSPSTTSSESSDNLRSVMGTLSLVCPAFLHICRNHIFSSITIKFSHSTYYPPFLSPVQRLRDLAKLLDDNPMLRRHVQSIKFIFPRPTIAEPRDMNFDGGLTSLFHLPNVTFISVEPADEDEEDTHHCPYPSICIHHNRVAYAEFTKSIIYSYLHAPSTRLTTLMIIDMDFVPLEDILSARSLLRLRLDSCTFKDALMYPPGSPTPTFSLTEFTAVNPDNLPVYLLSLCPNLHGLDISFWKEPTLKLQTSYKMRAGTTVDAAAAAMGTGVEPVSDAETNSDPHTSIDLSILPFSRLTKALFAGEQLRFKTFYEEAEKRGVMAFPVLEELIIFVDDELQDLLRVYDDDVDGGRKIDQLHRMFHHMPALKKLLIAGK